MTITALEEVVTAEIVRTPGEWAEIIRAEMARTAESIVLTGQYLIAAKADVAHGAWLPMLARIGISQQDANRYMTIARNLKSPKFGDLPPSATALYELSRLAPEAIDSGIESGDVHPGMTIKDAKGYAQEVTQRNAPANVNTDTGEIEPEQEAPEKPKRDRARERAEREASIVNDLRLYLRHIGTDKAITGMTDKAKQIVIEALEEAASNLKESM